MADALVEKELIRVRDHIKDPSRWCTEITAMDRTGFAVDPRSPRAVRWCPHGALSYYGSSDETLFALAETSSDIYGISFIYVNDRLGHRAIMHVLDVTIRRARGTDV